ncbi:MAG TPA: hypothetical protein VJ438_04075 [Candidatus Nanoarchaeia archaeon]|nr:hypothetical protein [Candidatus Nanoarchaeia archaeon]
MECYKCGANTAELFDVISGEGIVKICKYCLSEERIPVVKKPTFSQMNSINKNESIYNRLSKAAGLDSEIHKKNIFGSQQQQELKKQEGTLRELIDKKFDRFVKQESVKKRQDLIENFHWVIMRARRNKKMSMSQFAKEVGESEKFVKLAEQGIIPEGDSKIIQRIEHILEINILKPEVAKQLEHQRKQLGFDDLTTKNITISDLQEMKKEVIDLEIKEPYWRRLMSKIVGKRENPQILPLETNTQTDIKTEERTEETLEFESIKETPIEFDDTSLEVSSSIAKQDKDKINENSNSKVDLSDEEINDLIFGRKR